MQQGAPPQRRVLFNRLNQTLSYCNGIQAEELGQLPHSFAVFQPDGNQPPILGHSLESEPIHIYKTSVIFESC